TNDHAELVAETMTTRMPYGLGMTAKATDLQRESTVSAWTQIDNMSRSFEQLANISGPSMGAVTHGIASFTAATSVAHTSWKGLTTGFEDFQKGGLTNILSGLGGIVSGIGGIVAAAQAAVSAIKALWDAFQSEETKKVNKPRDAFQGQFGGFEGLAKALTDALISLGEEDAGNKALALLNAMNGARTEADWKKAQQAIADVFERAGKPVKQFADGGIATKPIAGIFGEAGDEALIPLDRLGSMVGFGGGTTQHITVNLEGRALVRTVVRGMPRELHLAGVGAF